MKQKVRSSFACHFLIFVILRRFVFACETRALKVTGKAAYWFAFKAVRQLIGRPVDQSGGRIRTTSRGIAGKPWRRKVVFTRFSGDLESARLAREKNTTQNNKNKKMTRQ